MQKKFKIRDNIRLVANGLEFFGSISFAVAKMLKSQGLSDFIEEIETVKKKKNAGN